MAAILQPVVADARVIAVAPTPTMAAVDSASELPLPALIPSTPPPDLALVKPSVEGATNTIIEAALTTEPASASSAVHKDRAQPAASLRDWSRFSIGFGIALVALALAVAAIFPPLVPPKQRIEVFMMSFAFGLLGTLGLFSGAMPRREGVGLSAQPEPTASSPASPPASPNPRPAMPVAPAARAPAAQAARDALLRRTQVGRSSSATVWGLTFGAIFVLAGISAPFLFPNTGPDERFLMMLGFAPVVAIGAILMVVFWRRMRPSQPRPAMVAATPSPAPTTSSAPRQARAPVPRAPNDAAFKFGVPAALAAMGVILALVIVLVVIATVVPLLSR